MVSRRSREMTFCVGENQKPVVIESCMGVTTIDSVARPGTTRAPINAARAAAEMAYRRCRLQSQMERVARTRNTKPQITYLLGALSIASVSLLARTLGGEKARTTAARVLPMSTCPYL